MSALHLADLSTLHAIVPLRSLSWGKARLGDAVDAEERELLLLAMLRHVMTVLLTWSPCAVVHVVSADARVLRLASQAGARPVTQVTGGLNEALRQARAAALADGATAMLILPADLPLLTSTSLDRLLEAADAAVAAGSGQPIVVIAPSDARAGTNALLLSPPNVIEPEYGVDSLERHSRAAAAVEASVQLVVDPALGFDLDTPEDLERLESSRLTELIAAAAADQLDEPDQPDTPVTESRRVTDSRQPTESSQTAAEPRSAAAETHR